jgi:hypothetical protein
MSRVQYPASHLQSSAESLPIDDVEKLVHGLQVARLVAPVVVENVEDGQFTHGPLVPFWYVPALHNTQLPADPE